MSGFARVLRPPGVCRVYSSFSSSRSGGRYFNHPKKPPATDATSTADAQPQEVKEQGSSGAEDPITTRRSTQRTTARTQNSFAEGASKPLSQNIQQIHHPVMTASDLRLHQFFSLDRPLLLLSNPASIFYNISNADAFSQSSHPPAVDEALHSPRIEFSSDADVEVARQLSRALTLNRVGVLLDWETTMEKLGVVPSKTLERLQAVHQTRRVWNDCVEQQGPFMDRTVYMDSVKRKRRKKMKKHKRKKRRRLTRMQKKD